MTVSLQELFDAGCHLGHPREKWHPRMRSWIYCEQDGIHLIDLEKTAAQLEKAKARIQELKTSGKNVVVVATKKQASEMVRDLAIESGVMYIVNRWPGGLLTNWEQVRRSVKRMSDIEQGLANGRYKDLTKYERMLLEKELARLERLFGGLKGLKNKPDALFVVDAQKEKNAVREAIKEKVEIIAMVDTNTDPTGISLVVPTNDDAISAIRLVVSEALSVRRQHRGEGVTPEIEENTHEQAKKAADVDEKSTKQEKKSDKSEKTKEDKATVTEKVEQKNSDESDEKGKNVDEKSAINHENDDASAKNAAEGENTSETKE
ncbi:30S ribosomal protein S2 [bacterium]|nr:30S ribosomal protein S2 [bacterium]